MDATASNPAVRFPSGRQFALTWSIPDNFGGMTAALLHRSRAFVRLAGTPVDILTFDGRPDYPRVERELRARGELVDGVRLTNLWDWFRENELREDAPGSLDLDRRRFAPLGSDPSYVSTWRGDHELSRARVEGTRILQIDYYREDGTLLASDQRDGGSRDVVLCDRAGSPTRSFGGVWAFYRFWLDVLRDREPSFMVVDSKTVAAFMATYRRKRAVVVHVVHGSHLSGQSLSSSRRAAFEHLDSYDSVVLLTRAQRDDVETLLGQHDNLAVIGNGRDLPAFGGSEPRDPGAGMMLASLTSRKRIDHAVRAVSAASAGHPLLGIDVFGDGPERDRVASLIGDLDSPVRLRGHVPDARGMLDAASFLLLTSASEGLPLVLVEAMAAGCIPVAYDIAYGPADLIRDGYNGFLVPDGDTDALARAIERLQSFTPRQWARLRRHARRTARQFSDASVTRLWAAEFRAAAARKATAWAAEHRKAG